MLSINQEIIVECFLERVENFIQEYNKLREEDNQNYLSYESRVFDLIAELSGDLQYAENTKKYESEE